MTDREEFFRENLGRILEAYRQDIGHWRSLGQGGTVQNDLLTQVPLYSQKASYAIMNKFFRQTDEAT